MLILKLLVCWFIFATVLGLVVGRWMHTGKRRL